MNPIIQMLMGNLQQKNPQMAQQINQMMSNGANPEAMLQQLLGNVNPQQMQGIINYARGLGCPDDVLKKIQNIKK